MQATAPEQTRPPTLQDVAKQEKALADLRAKAADLRDEEARLQTEVHEALAAGEAAEEARDALREARELRKDLEAAEGVLEERIEETRAEAKRELARERLQTICKKVGGLCGETPRRAETAEELAGKLVSQLTWLAEAPARRRLLVEEAEILAATFDLQLPEFRRPDVNIEKTLARLKGEVRGVYGFPTRPLLTVRQDRNAGNYQEAAATVARLLRRHFDEESPTPELLEDAESEEDTQAA